MKAAGRVVLLAFDACDVDLVRDLAAADKLPTFRKLFESWASATVRNPYGIFVNAIWPTFFTARSPERIRFHCWETVSPATYERRLTTPREIVGEPFWRQLSTAGRRIAIIDVPHARTEGRVNGIEIFEYGSHDKHFGFHTSPPELANDIVGRVGLHTVLTADPYMEQHLAPDDYAHRKGPLRTATEERALLLDMLDGLERKRQLSTWILGQGGWDLFLSVFSEGHAIGHQCWHLHDPTHPRHDPALADSLGDPVEQVYVALDRALAKHLAMIDNESTVLVLLSHGMGPHYDGTHLLEEILTRIDAYDRPDASGNIVRLTKSIWPRLSPTSCPSSTSPLIGIIRRTAPWIWPLAGLNGDAGVAHRARRRFFLSPNNSVYGGVRINLVGREPSGLVRPGSEYERVCAAIRQDLLGLVNVDTGEPVVRAVERTDDHYSRETVDELPDLIIDWNHNGPIETIWSPKTGVIYGPYTHWRTGDHRPPGHLFVAGPNIPSGVNFGELFIGDLAPTICAMLGHELKGADGRPVQKLLTRKQPLNTE
jgi:predicted AlkP superfamily phosphohydrolase/phosphomutase